MIWFAVLVLLTGLERIWELIVSTRNARWAFERGGREFGQSHYPSMVVLHTGVATTSEWMPSGTPGCCWRSSTHSTRASSANVRILCWGTHRCTRRSSRAGRRCRCTPIVARSGWSGVPCPPRAPR